MTLDDSFFHWLFTPSFLRLAAPVLIALAGLAIARARGQARSPWETFTNISTYVAIIVVNTLIANAIFHFAFGKIGNAVPFKLPVNVATFVLAFVLVDLSHYLRHRLSHRVSLLWCVHGIHHSSEELNFATALRLSPLDPLYIWAFYAPLLLLGLPGKLITAALVMNLLYQLYFVHSEHVGKIPVLDKILGTPSNHRVHHGVNPEYLDQNYGGVLMIWDHLFGTYVPEVAAPKFGTVEPIGTRNPWLVTFRPFVRLYAKVAREKNFRGRLRALLGPPNAPETA